MLDEYFEEQMQEIIRMCSHQRQTMLFSATMTDEVGRGDAPWRAEWRRQHRGPRAGLEGMAWAEHGLVCRSASCQVSEHPVLVPGRSKIWLLSP